MRLAVCVLLLAHAAALTPQDEPKPYWKLLLRVHERMGQQVLQFPNYTCAEHITRSMFAGSPRTLVRRDRVRLEVAIADGKELFAWPGDPFEQDDPSKLTGEGMIGTGDFAAFLRTIFHSGTLSAAAGQLGTFAGRPAVRFPYRVAEQTYTLRVRGLQTTVSIHGSLWVDLASERLAGLEVAADAIPKALGLSALETRLELRPAVIGGRDLDMPAVTTLIARYPDGEYEYSKVEQTNRIEFRNCRQYTAESTISFGEEAGVAALTTAKAQPRNVPAGTRLRVALETPIDASVSAAGDAITATVLKPVRAGSLTIPQGARLHGRLLVLRIDIQDPGVMADLEFSRIEFAGARYAFSGRLKSFGKLRGLRLNTPEGTVPQIFTHRHVLAGPASFQMRNGLLSIPAGFEMEWVAADDDGQDSARTTQ